MYMYIYIRIYMILCMYTMTRFATSISRQNARERMS